MTTTPRTQPTQPVAALPGALRRAGIVVLAALTMLGVLVGGSGTALAADYDYYQSDSFSMWDSTQHVYTSGGQVDWYRDRLLFPVYRGQLSRSSYVVLATAGCLWTKVSWRTVTGSVSWPPSGSANTVSDGWFRACGPRGTWVSLAGVSYASRSLAGATVCVGFSTYANYTLRRGDACTSMYN